MDDVQTIRPLSTLGLPPLYENKGEKLLVFGNAHGETKRRKDQRDQRDYAMSFAFGSTVLAYDTHEYRPHLFDFSLPRNVNLEELSVGDYIETSHGFDKVTKIVAYYCPDSAANLSTVFGLRTTADVVILFDTTWRRMCTIAPETQQHCTGLLSIETELFNNIVVDGVQCLLCPCVSQEPPVLQHVRLCMRGYPYVSGDSPTPRL